MVDIIDIEDGTDERSDSDARDNDNETPGNKINDVQESDKEE
jgi:hypothetical protein